MKFSKLVLPLAAVAMVAACNTGGNNTGSPSFTPGGGSPVTFGSKLTGQFIDAPVNGLNYYINSDSSNKKRTSGKGNFTCEVGDVVTFLLGTMEMGKAPCANAVTPYALNLAGNALTLDQVKFLAVTFQNMGGGASSSLLDVGFLANQDVGSLVDLTTVNGGSAATDYATFSGAVGRGAVADYTAAATAALDAMEDYISSITNIPAAFIGKKFEAEINAKLVSGSTDWCDTEIQFDFVATAKKNEDGSTEANWSATAGSTTVDGPLFAPAFYFAVPGSDADGTYMSTGSAAISSKGTFSGSFVETTLTVTDPEDNAFKGTSCVYSFGPVEGDVTPYPEDSSFAE